MLLWQLNYIALYLVSPQPSLLFLVLGGRPSISYVYQFGCHDQVIRDVIKSGHILTAQTTPIACS